MKVHNVNKYNTVIQKKLFDRKIVWLSLFYIKPMDDDNNKQEKVIYLFTKVSVLETICLWTDVRPPNR